MRQLVFSTESTVLSNTPRLTPLLLRHLTPFLVAHDLEQASVWRSQDNPESDQELNLNYKHVGDFLHPGLDHTDTEAHARRLRGSHFIFHVCDRFMVKLYANSERLTAHRELMLVLKTDLEAVFEKITTEFNVAPE